MNLVAQSFGSGSSGNGLFIRSGATSLLIDCGIGPRILAAHLKPHETVLRDLSAVLITHEHDDHVRCLAPLRKLDIPIRCSHGTAAALRLSEREHVSIGAGSPFTIGDAVISAIAVSHDATEPFGYAITLEGVRICIVTDLGATSDELAEAVASADLIVLEANHDEHMLRSGPYPAHLKRRVASSSGHLSNEHCALFLEAALRGDPKPRTIWLAHLSETNNRPELARRTVARSLGGDAALHEIVALPRRSPGPVWSPSPNAQPMQLGLLSSGFGVEPRARQRLGSSGA